jgi:hypothetical protein
MFNQLEIHMLTYKRPLHFLVTIFTLRLMLGAHANNIKFKILSQNVSSIKFLFARLLFRDVQIVQKKANVGMLAGWQELQLNISRPIIMLLEDDWASIVPNKNNFILALSSMIEGTADFIKLRIIKDFDDYGFGNPLVSPWTSKKSNILSYNTDSNFYKSNNQFVAFTFNPCLIRADLYKELLENLTNDTNDETPLRSGENQVIIKWRKLKKISVYQLKIGCFTHIGFHSRRDYLFRMPRLFWILATGVHKWKKF